MIRADFNNRRAALAAALALSLLLCGSATFAEKGYDAFRAGDMQTAIELFQRAEQRYHAPHHLLFIARARAKQGQLAEARDSYRQLVDEKLADYAPAQFHDAQREAVEELSALEPRVPKIRLVIRGDPRGDAVVWVDGRRLENAPTSLWLNPGQHRIAVSTGEEALSPRLVDLAEGDERELVFELGDAPEQRDATSLLTPSLVAFGVGAAALAVGTGFGVASMRKVEGVRAQCNGDICPERLQPEAEDAAVLGNVSTAFLVVGGALIATGAVLLAVDLSGAAETSPQAGGVGHLELRFTGSGLLLGARF